MDPQTQQQTRLLDQRDTGAITASTPAPVRPLSFLNLFVELVKHSVRSGWDAGRYLGITVVPLFMVAALAIVPPTLGWSALFSAGLRHADGLMIGLVLGPMYIGGLGVFLGLLTGVVLAPLVRLLYALPWHITLHRTAIRAACLALAVVAGPSHLSLTLRRYREDLLEWETWWSRGILTLLVAGIWVYLVGRCVEWYEDDRVDREPVPLVGRLKPQRLDDPAFRRDLFAALATRYDRASAAASLGFSRHWRAQLVAHTYLAPDMAVCDLMTGTGALWPHLLRQIGPQGSITAVDSSPEMLEQARHRRARLDRPEAVALHKADACATGLPAESFDAVVCSFGVKTLSLERQMELASEIHRLLRPGGVFGIVELSQPQRWLLRTAQRLHLAHVAPLIAEVLGASPHAHALLSAYAARTKDLNPLAARLYTRGATVHTYRLAGGCAMLIVGIKDIVPPYQPDISI
ncbi:MAG TPA: class I SAM-dependent methyltransferase [Roseiflexaceae bacterium]|nr:class I SAM-dependent methyltransferase [Roseiflexaceae bacterium]